MGSEYDRQWYAKNRRRKWEYEKVWRKNNPEKYRAQRRRERDKLRARRLAAMDGSMPPWNGGRKTIERLAWEAANPEEAARILAARKTEAARIYRRLHPDIVRARKRRQKIRQRERLRAECPDEWRRRMRRKHLQKYGITPDQYDAMVLSQGGLCGSCGDVAALVVDHIHGTKPVVVRALICQACNFTIGHSDESPRRLRCCADYIERYALPVAA